MRRIGLVLALSFVLAPPTVVSPQEARVYRIGYLGIQGPTASPAVKTVAELKTTLRDLGYVEGKNIVIESRWAEEKYERLPQLAAELVRAKVEVVPSKNSSVAKILSCAK